MNFRGFTSKDNNPSGGAKMAASGLCSSNTTTSSISSHVQMVNSAFSEPMFSYSPLSLALGFTSKDNNPSGGAKMAASGLRSSNTTTGSISSHVQMANSTFSQPMFSYSPLSLALMENLGDMSLTRQNYGVAGRTRDDELENLVESDSLEDVTGDEQNTTGNRSSKRKKYHRYSAIQVQELETSFKENPYPNEKQRSELGKRLVLEIRQIKFWFQNRRTQMKKQLERHDNLILKEENDKLRVENVSVKEAVRSPICNNCGGPAILGEVPIEHQHLLIENARLKDELKRLWGKGNGAGNKVTEEDIY